MTNVFHFSGKLPRRFLIILIALVVFTCYLPTLNNGFVWDDTYNLIENVNYRGLSLSHLHWMFTTFYDENYHPLLWLTLGVDFVFWGVNPAGYHVTNLMLHVLNALLFYFLIGASLRQTADSSDRAIGIQISAAVGAFFFAVHPLRVEPVAWVSARGDILCGFFYLLTVIAYVRMSETEAPADRRRWFLLALLFFVLSLLSRAWGMTLPLVLLILDLYPLQRFDLSGRSTASLKTIVTEKIPFALFALGGAILAFLAKKRSMLIVAEHGIIERLMQAAYGLGFYLWKTVVPIRLSPAYILDQNIDLLGLKFIVCAVFVLCISAGLVFMRHRWPWATTAWVCYAVIISPQLGFVQSGPQIAADRYTYIACMPFGVLVGAGVYKLWLAWQTERLSSAGWFSAMAVIWVGLIVLTVISFRQTRIWHDNATFWSYVIKLDPDSYVAYNNRAVFFKEQKKDFIKAMEDYNAAIELYPEYADAYYNRGLLHEHQGDLADAIADYSNVVRLNPRHAKAYNNRGGLRNEQGDAVGAINDFNTAIRLAPFSPEAYANRGMIRLSQNNLNGAIQDFDKALEVASAKWDSRSQVEEIIINIRSRLEKQE